MSNLKNRDTKKPVVLRRASAWLPIKFARSCGMLEVTVSVDSTLG